MGELKNVTRCWLLVLRSYGLMQFSFFSKYQENVTPCWLLVLSSFRYYTFCYSELYLLSKKRGTANK